MGFTKEARGATNLLSEVWVLVRSGEMTPERMQLIRNESFLGQIMVAGLNNSKHGREIMKESIQEAAQHVMHQMERFLNSLGTIAASLLCWGCWVLLSA